MADAVDDPIPGAVCAWSDRGGSGDTADETVSSAEGVGAPIRVERPIPALTRDLCDDVRGLAPSFGATSIGSSSLLRRLGYVIAAWNRNHRPGRTQLFANVARYPECAT